MRSKILVGVLAAAVAFLLATSPLTAQAVAFITSGDIVNNTIKSKDVKDGNLKGVDVKDDSLTGSDITESTLAVVPNSTSLNGLAASTYLNRAYTFTIPTTAASTEKNFAATGVPAGTYLVDYNVITTSAGPRCLLYPNSPPSGSAVGVSDAYGTGGVFFASASAVITVPAGQTPTLRCFGASFGTYSAPGDALSTMSFTKLDTVTSGTPTVTKAGPPSKPGGVS